MGFVGGISPSTWPLDLLGAMSIVEWLRTVSEVEPLLPMNRKWVRQRRIKACSYRIRYEGMHRLLKQKCVFAVI